MPARSARLSQQPEVESRQQDGLDRLAMASFLRAAFQILTERKSPMTSGDITRAALESALLHTAGATPEETMRARLSTDILRRKERSPFMRTDAGSFGLRVWGLPEYVAPRFTKSLFDEDIAV